MKLFFTFIGKIKINKNDKDWHSKNTNYCKIGTKLSINSIIDISFSFLNIVSSNIYTETI